MPKSRLIILGALGLIVIFFVLVFLGVIPGLQPDKGKETVNLAFWGVNDHPDIINELAGRVPGYKITYRQIDPDVYESELINALAAGAGPDVFMFHSSWLPKHYDKLVPINSDQLGIGSLRDFFPAVIEQDLSSQGLIYGAPLYLDTLVMLYNKNIFDQKGVVLAPKTWAEFQTLMPKLRETDSSGRLTRAGAAIGGSSRSVSQAPDLLSLLMLQTGTPMVKNDFSEADFTAGLNALNFYTSFANPANSAFAWSEAFGYSLDTFANEKTAVIFNYGESLGAIKERNPFLEIGIAGMPQPAQSQNSVNFANYWGLAVSNQTSNPLAAWNFIWQFTANQDNARVYAEKTNRLPALRSLIDERVNDPAWSVFARQALTARSWPQIDSSQVSLIFSRMIEDVITGRATPAKALSEAEAAVTELMARKRQF